MEINNEIDEKETKKKSMKDAKKKKRKRIPNKYSEQEQRDYYLSIDVNRDAS